jgi:hypothetical protein
LTAALAVPANVATARIAMRALFVESFIAFL